VRSRSGAPGSLGVRRRRPSVPGKAVGPGQRSAADDLNTLPRGLRARLSEAADSYSADRYGDALKLLQRLVVQAPSSPAVRELLGLTYYRLGRWGLAVRELEQHHELSGSYDQYPVIADCYRALCRHEDAEAVWLELRQVSPSAEVVAEGRLVEAGLLADRGDLRGAVRLLERSLRSANPRPYDLRQWYALADLYERAGELPRARELFAKLAKADPEAYDVSQRLLALG
jgi:tetratricopeptide (TPR) repeat protein